MIPKNLGIIYENGEIINHRSMLKVIVNPVLRVFGFQLCTIFHGKNLLWLPRIYRCPPRKLDFSKSWNYEIGPFTTVQKKRIII